MAATPSQRRALALNRELRAGVQLRERLSNLCEVWEKTDPIKVVILRELLDPRSDHG